MAPVRLRDIRRDSLPTPPRAARRLSKGLKVDIHLANRTSEVPNLSSANLELEISLAAKEAELETMLMSPITPLPVPHTRSLRSKLLPYGIPRFTSIINSIDGFNGIGAWFLDPFSGLDG